MKTQIFLRESLSLAAKERAMAVSSRKQARECSPRRLKKKLNLLKKATLHDKRRIDALEASRGWLEIIRYDRIKARR